MNKPCPLFLLISCLCWGTALAAEPSPAMVILIDDVGDNYERGRAAVDLPGNITYAVLPHSPFGPKLARRAQTQGKEVILHAPMQNEHNRALGPGALTQDLDKDAFIEMLKGDLDSVPGAVGLNNHMGSYLTKLRPQMEWVMDVAKERNLFFIDSRTTAQSLAIDVAREKGVPNLTRNVFLDHERRWEFLHKQFTEAVFHARREGSVVIIGHPYPVTLAYLKRALPVLDAIGIRVVSPSQLIQERQQALLAVSDEKEEADSTEAARH